MATTAAFIYSDALEKYSYPPEHPFNTARAKRTRDLVQSMGLLGSEGRAEVSPQAAPRLTLKKFHTAQYLHILQGASRGRWDIEALNMGLGTSDCPIFKGMYPYAVLATGATLVGAKQILSGKARVAFNPSGGFHHAHPERAAGFCYINDVALACMVLAEKGKRVLYLDVDVHHGDGVAYAFYDRPDVMTISLHQNPRTLFPGTGYEDEIGEGAGKGYCVNIPMPIGTYDQAYMLAFEGVAVPLIEAFNPDVFVFELGADALAGDPLANLQLTNNVYVEVIEHMLKFDRPILMTGGGGYNIQNTVRAWALAWSTVSGAEENPYSSVGAGGVMLSSTEWHGGLRDRSLPVTSQQREMVLSAVESTVDRLKKLLFPIHKI